LQLGFVTYLLNRPRTFVRDLRFYGFFYAIEGSCDKIKCMLYL
jgi:hypothetical protein